MRILVVDLETSGLDPLTHGVIEIGACWLDAQGEQHFFRECQPMPGRLLDYEALAISETWPAALAGRMWESVAYAELLHFCGTGRVMIAGMNPHFDLSFLRDLAKRSGLPCPFMHRVLDMHSLAVDMAIRCGKQDKVMKLHTDAIYELLELAPEPRPHRANTGALKEREALRAMLGL